MASPKKKSDKNHTDTVNVPMQRSILDYAAPALVFLGSLVMYLLTLAPDVTFEDSGELIAAAYNLGVPHQPGYPLFTLIGKIFSMLPVGEVAFRLNLMSAVMSAVGAGLIAWATILLIEMLFVETNDEKKLSGLPKYLIALTVGLLVASAFENWEQSIITEVYGLNTLLTCVLVLVGVYWLRSGNTKQRDRWFLLGCYIVGLSLSNHTTSLMFIPILLTLIAAENYRYILDWRRFLSALVAMAAGLLPYLYLPLASRRNPWMDWGNPENWTNFWRTVSRHQYNLNESQNLTKFVAQFQAYLEMLADQWFFFVPLLALPAIWLLFQKDKRLLAFLGIFFLFSAPITTYMTNFDLTLPDAFVAAEHRALVSVFYIPSYICIALLVGLGSYYLVSLLRLATTSKALIAATLLALPAGAAWQNAPKVDMSEYHFASDYLDNVFAVAGENAMIWANWDPYYFPSNYRQFVQGERLDVLFIDQQLLRRSWYIQWLRDHYPAFMAGINSATNEFLAAVTPFEEGLPYNGNFIQQKYEKLINAMIDKGIGEGRDVLFTYTPPRGIAGQYEKEPLIVALKIKRPNTPVREIAAEQFEFRGLTDNGISLDRMAKVFQSYYGGLAVSRGQFLAAKGRLTEANDCFVLAENFFRQQPAMRNRIQEMRRRLQSIGE